MAKRIQKIDPTSPVGLALATQIPERQLRKRPKRTPGQRFPLMLEREYVAATRRAGDQVSEIVREEVIPELPELERRAAAGDLLWPASVAAIFAGVSSVWEERAQVAEGVAAGFAQRVSSFNRSQIGRQIKSVTGLDLIPNERQTDALIEAFASENASLIKGMGDRQIAEIQGIVTRALRGGRRAAEVASEVQKRFSVTRSRASLIGRDQIAKLNGQLTRVRQLGLGIGQYIWRTSRDERVRATHAVMEGTLQSWDNPPLVGGRRLHPGEDFQCRCTASPVIPGLTPAPS